MNDQEPNQNPLQANREQTKRLWVTPAFERSELKDALSGHGGSSYDGLSSYTIIYS